MYLGFPEEGDRCPEQGCDGRLEFPAVENCACHLNPPCGACTDNRLACDSCGWEDNSPDHKPIMVAPGLAIVEPRPRPLDPTRIDYRIKMHSSSSQLVEGVYPEGTTKADVQAKVNGTFGGRFEQFGGGKFKFIAYTD